MSILKRRKSYLWMCLLVAWGDYCSFGCCAKPCRVVIPADPPLYVSLYIQGRYVLHVLHDGAYENRLTS